MARALISRTCSATKRPGCCGPLHAIAGWCRECGVTWEEHAQTGVVRGRRSRNGWARGSQARMNRALVRPKAQGWVNGLRRGTFASLRELRLPAPRAILPSGDETAWGHWRTCSIGGVVAIGLNFRVGSRQNGGVRDFPCSWRSAQFRCDRFIKLPRHQSAHCNAVAT